jgi:hypothetical protein
VEWDLVSCNRSRFRILMKRRDSEIWEPKILLSGNLTGHTWKAKIRNLNGVGDLEVYG